MAGRPYADRVRETVPALAAVARITNGSPSVVALDRERDVVKLRMNDGREIPRADLWARGEWMVAIAELPEEERSRFVYPRGVIPNAGVEFTLTFDTDASIDDIEAIWVRLQNVDAPGVWLEPLKG